MKKDKMTAMMKMKSPPHPHSDVIKAWADGETIQWKESSGTIWVDYLFRDKLNFSNPNIEWRIKPKTKTFQCRTALFKNSNGFYAEVFDSESDSGEESDWFMEGRNPPELSFVRWITDLISFEVLVDEGGE